MSGIIIFGLLVAVIAGATLLLRVPAALIFFSLLVGQLLSDQVSDDIYYFVGTLLGADSGRWIKPILLLLPVVLSLAFLRGTVSKRKMLAEIIPAALTGVTAALLIVPLVPVINSALADSQIWSEIMLYKSLIIFTASLAGLVSCWFSFSKSHRA